MYGLMVIEMTHFSLVGVCVIMWLKYTRSTLMEFLGISILDLHLLLCLFIFTYISLFYL